MSSRSGARRFRGAYPVLVTPFDASGAVDLRSLRRLVADQVSVGVSGVVAFGLASEGYKLSDAERAAMLDVIVDEAAGRVDVVAGTEHTSAEVAAERSADAVRRGATALMLFPPSFARATADGLVAHYASVAAAAPRTPLIVQDAPAWTGVDMPVSLLVRLATMVPQAAYVKVEAPPTGPKIDLLEDAGVECVGGHGALHLGEELDRGTTATMPGCGYSRWYVDLLRMHAENDPAAARRLHHRLLPLTVHAMASLDVFISLHKRLLVRRGILDHDGMRRPFVAPDARQVRIGDELLELVGVGVDGGGSPIGGSP